MEVVAHVAAVPELLKHHHLLAARRLRGCCSYSVAEVRWCRRLYFSGQHSGGACHTRRQAQRRGCSYTEAAQCSTAPLGSSRGQREARALGQDAADAPARPGRPPPARLRGCCTCHQQRPPTQRRRALPSPTPAQAHRKSCAPSRDNKSNNPCSVSSNANTHRRARRPRPRRDGGPLRSAAVGRRHAGRTGAPALRRHPEHAAVAAAGGPRPHARAGRCAPRR